MKKAIVFLCFFGGAACFISAGLYINKNNAGMINTTQESVQKVKSPELLSDINMTQYVSLPASFSDIDIVEDLDNIEVTEDNVNDIIYDKLLSTATHLSTASDDGILLMVDYTVTVSQTSSASGVVSYVTTTSSFSVFCASFSPIQLPSSVSTVINEGIPNLYCFCIILSLLFPSVSFQADTNVLFKKFFINPLS